jgi:hypothetical protein
MRENFDVGFKRETASYWSNVHARMHFFNQSTCAIRDHGDGVL